MTPHPISTTDTAFDDAAHAWFWTIGALRARHEGTRHRANSTRRPCEPDDIIRCLDRLYRAGEIGPAHARVLRIWGERGVPPDATHPADRDAARLWSEALARLAPALHARRLIERAASPQNHVSRFFFLDSSCRIQLA